VVTTSLRRSSRLNANAEAVQHVRLPYAPKKRRHPVVPEPVEGQTKRKLTLTTPPQADEEIPSPIPIQTMREWGLDCNVSPAEFTDEALLSRGVKKSFHDDIDPEA